MHINIEFQFIKQGDFRTISDPATGPNPYIIGPRKVLFYEVDFRTSLTGQVKAEMSKKLNEWLNNKRKEIFSEYYTEIILKNASILLQIEDDYNTYMDEIMIREKVKDFLRQAQNFINTNQYK